MAEGVTPRCSLSLRERVGVRGFWGWNGGVRAPVPCGPEVAPQDPLTPALSRGERGKRA